MIEKVAAYMTAHQMAKDNDHVIVGVSGGADSVCLLLVLSELRRKMGFAVSVVHIEHGIRGEESLFDMEFTKRLCLEREISFVCRRYPVLEIAAREKISVEEAGRNARYEAFRQEEARLMQEVSARGGRVKTAVAHHADDNAETILFHLCRGSGLDGLCGIAPVRGSVIRPLLCVTRCEIEAFLKQKGQDYRTDATNEDVAYSRNRIRRNVMPQLSEVNEKAVWHMNCLAEEAADISAYLCLETGRILKAGIKRRTERELWFALSEFAGLPDVLKRRLLLELLREALGARKDIGREHVAALAALAEGATGRRLSLPRGIIAEKSYEWLAFYPDRKKADENELAPEVWADEFPMDVILPKGRVRCRIFSVLKKDVQIPKNMYTKWFDYDKIKNRLCFRLRKPGDFFIVDRQGHRQKLKDYWINEKVPKRERENALLLSDGPHIVWAIGYRISEYYKVTEQTKCVLEVRYGEEDYE